MRRSIGLDAWSPARQASWGAKAAALGELRAAGYRVPDGVVLEAATGQPTEAELDELWHAVAQLGDVELAVRSSSTGEDLPDYAAAGRYATLLGVRGEPALRQAVRECLASAGGEPMAVLVQRLVHPSAAGVAFSADPVTGDAGVTVVEAVPGLGASLVSGEATPEEWRVTDVARPVREEAVLTAEQAMSIAELARRVESDRGAPQDIEWAIADDQLYLLQARPITTLIEPVPIPIEVPGGRWELDDVHCPEPPTPITTSMWQLNPAWLRISEMLGLPVTLRAELIGGWPYGGVLPAGIDAKPGKKLPPPPPGWLLPLLLRLVPATRRRLKAARRTVREDTVSAIIRRYHAEYLPEQRRMIALLRDAPLADMSDSALADHLALCRDFLSDSALKHFEVAFPQLFTTAELALFCEDRLGWDFDRVLELLVGTSSVTSEPARELARIAAKGGTPEELAADLAEYQRTYGCRSLSAELADPTFAEMPGLLERQLEAQRGFDPEAETEALAVRRSSAAEEARSQLDGRARQEFDRLLERALAAYPVRDDNAFYTLDAPFAVTRYALLEAGRRMTSAGTLSAVGDIFYCRIEEVLDWLSAGTERRAADRSALRAAVRRRRGERLWAIAHHGPRSYGPDPGEPPLRWLPEPFRTQTRLIDFSMRHILGTSRPAMETTDARGTLTGIGASAGTYTGRVRIIASETEFSRIERGDVLVCMSTRPSWSVIFPSLGAVIADVGGLLSHPAIIAREHRIPAVVATGEARHVLRDGQPVTVDGRSGVVSFDPDWTPAPTEGRVGAAAS